MKKVTVFIMTHKPILLKLAAGLIGGLALGMYAEACNDEGEQKGYELMRWTANQFIPDFEEQYDNWLTNDALK